MGRERTMEPDYRVKLDVFEGPFDLLLYLIKKDEIDVYDIPIAKVTDQYLNFLEAMRQQGIDIASEWLVMAATLVQIKSRMLLPLEEDRPEEWDEESDPRFELIEKLIEYRKYKEIAQDLEQRELHEMDFFRRSLWEPEEEESLIEVDLYDLISAFKNVVDYAAPAPFTEVLKDEYTVEDKMEELQERLRAQRSMSWNDVFAEGRALAEMVAILLAILELIRLGKLRVRQKKSFGDIRIFATKELISHDE
jgi:segregation and condensation protein A